MPQLTRGCQNGLTSATSFRDKNFSRPDSGFIFIKNIILNQITIDEYRLLIQKFYGYIAPCELLIKEHPSAKILITGREKTVLLQQDLQALGITVMPAHCNHLPLLLEYEQILGYLYVMEGSTLGGQIFTKILQTQLAITENLGGNFFNAYGRNTETMWASFCNELNNVTNTELKNKVIDSACVTYNKLHQWLQILPTNNVIEDIYYE